MKNERPLASRIWRREYPSGCFLGVGPKMHNHLFVCDAVLADTQANTSLERLEGIREVLSSLAVSTIRTDKEMMRALWTLDIANRCIHVVLADFPDEAGAEHLVRQSESLFALIQFARRKIAGLRKIPGGAVNAERLVRGSAIAGRS